MLFSCQFYKKESYKGRKSKRHKLLLDRDGQLSLSTVPQGFVNQSSGKPVRQESSPVSGQQKNGELFCTPFVNLRSLYPASQEQLLSYTTVVHSAQFPVPLQFVPVRDEHGAQSEEDKQMKDNLGSIDDCVWLLETVTR